MYGILRAYCWCLSEYDGIWLWFYSLVSAFDRYGDYALLFRMLIRSSKWLISSLDLPARRFSHHLNIITQTIGVFYDAYGISGISWIRDRNSKNKKRFNWPYLIIFYKQTNTGTPISKQMLSKKDTNLLRPHTALTTQTSSRKKKIDKGENVCDKQLWENDCLSVEESHRRSQNTAYKPRKTSTRSPLFPPLPPFISLCGPLPFPLPLLLPFEYSFSIHCFIVDREER